MNKRGITLVGLIVIIIVMLIIVTVVTYTGVEAVSRTKLTAFNAELKIIQARVNEIAEENLTPVELSGLGKTLATVDGYTYGKIEIALLAEGKSATGFLYLGEEELKNLGVDGIKREVVINFETRDVIDINGITQDGVLRYTTSDKMHNIEYQPPVSTIVFTTDKFVNDLEATINITKEVGTRLKYTKLEGATEVRLE